MTRLALIPPVDLLEYTKLTDYQLVLPHLLKSDDIYCNFYRRLADKHENFIIMDNGEAEGENKYSSLELIKMAIHYGFDEVVAKDVMGNMLATIDSTEEFLDTAYHYVDDERILVGIVAQGDSFQEIEAFVEYFIHGKYKDIIQTIYLPRHLISTLRDTEARHKLVKKLDDMFHLKGKYDIHYLGANGDAPMEMMTLALDLPWVRGMDTSMPFNYAYSNELVGDIKIHRPKDYFSIEMFEFERPDLIRQNIDLMLNWAAKGK